MSGVNVLAVLGKCVKYTEMTARKYGGETLANHANEVSEARAAVAELIEAGEEFAACDSLDAQKRFKAALSRVRGAE